MGFYYVVLVLSTLFFGGSSLLTDEMPAAEPHGPIVIAGDLTAMVPDVIGGNGIRQGRGTAADPWIIHGWEIAASGEPFQHAITIRDLQGFLQIRNVQITGTHTTGNSIHVLHSPNVKIEGVTFEGHGAALFAKDSGITMNNVNIDLDSQSDGACIYLEDAQTMLDNLTLSQPCRRTFIGALNGKLDVQNVETHAQPNLIVASGDVELSVSNVTGVTGDQAAASLGAVAFGIAVDRTQNASAVLNQIHLEGYQRCVGIMLAEALTFELRGGSLDGCGGSTGGHALYIWDVEGQVTLEDVSITNSDVGLETLGGGRIELNNAFLAYNRVGLDLPDITEEPRYPQVTVRSSTVVDNRVQARGAHTSTLIFVDSYVSPTPEFGEVIAPADGPLHPINPRHDAGMTGPGILVALLLGLLTWKRNT